MVQISEVASRDGPRKESLGRAEAFCSFGNRLRFKDAFHIVDLAKVRYGILQTPPRTLP